MLGLSEPLISWLQEGSKGMCGEAHAGPPTPTYSVLSGHLAEPPAALCPDRGQQPQAGPCSQAQGQCPALDVTVPPSVLMAGHPNSPALVKSGVVSLLAPSATTVDTALGPGRSGPAVTS